jgi:hypothetical protein
MIYGGSSEGGTLSTASVHRSHLRLLLLQRPKYFRSKYLAGK